MRSRSTMFALTMVLVSGISISIAQGESGTPENENVKRQTVVIHLSHFTDDLHRVFMALKIATMMQNAGVKTTLFLDIEGARLSDSRQSLDVHWGPSSVALGELLNSFIKSGGKITVCPHCAMAAGIAAEHVRDGAKIATEEGLATMLIHADKIMDY